MLIVFPLYLSFHIQQFCHWIWSEDGGHFDRTQTLVLTDHPKVADSELLSNYPAAEYQTDCTHHSDRQWIWYGQLIWPRKQNELGRVHFRSALSLGHIDRASGYLYTMSLPSLLQLPHYIWPTKEQVVSFFGPVKPANTTRDIKAFQMLLRIMDLTSRHDSSGSGWYQNF